MNRKSIFVAVKATFMLVVLTQALAVVLSLTEFTACAQRMRFDKLVYRFDKDTNGSIGTLFNATVRVEDVEDVAAWQVTVLYNDTMINVTRWFEPRWDPEYVFYEEITLAVPYPPTYMYASIAPGNGSARVSATLMPAPPVQPSFTGTGILCILEFNITAVPEEGMYNCTLTIDNEGEHYRSYILNPDANEMPVDRINGYYEIIPEFHPLLILPIFILITVLAIALAKKGIRKSKVYTAHVNN